MSAILRKYGEAATVNFDLFEVDGVDFRVDAAHASGDTKIMKDEGAEANTTNGFTDEGNGYSIVLTATEMQAARIVIYVIDSATKAWLDRAIVIETYGHASAQHALDLDSATVDVGAISGDATAADNLESQYDGTGVTGDTFPATQVQLGQLSVGSAAISTASESYVLTTGAQSSGTFADTTTLNSVYHEHTDATGVMELYYQFDVGGVGVATTVTVDGRINGNNDDLDGVYAWNWVSSAWDRIGDFTGQTSSSDIERVFDLLTAHTGTASNAGKVRIRFFAASGLTSATLNIDRIFTSYAVVSQTVGYADGAIWIDTNGSNTNTENYVDGVADNPVSTWAAALTLSGQLGITRFRVVNGSAITLTGNSDNYSIIGQEYTLAFGGQSTAALYVFGGSVSGVGTGSALLEDCPVGDITLPPSIMRRCFIFGTITNSGVGDWFINDPRSRVAGAGSPVFDFGTAVGNTNLNIRGNSGGWQLEAMGDTGTDTASIEGWGQVIEGTCTAGTVVVRGNFTTSGITNLTLSDDARIDVAQINAEADTALSDFFTSSDQLVQDFWNKVLSRANFNVGQSGAKMLRELGVMIAAEGAVSGTPTTTVFITNITGFDDDFFVDQVVAAYNGAAQAGQGRVVSAYNGTTGEFTVDEAFTTALVSGDDVVVLTPHVHDITQIQMGLATSVELATHDGKLDTAQTDLDTITGSDGVTLATTQGNYAPNTVVPDAAGTAPTVAEILTTQMTESYAADGVAPTLAQAIFAIQQQAGDFSISGTTITVKKLDGSTTAMVFTLDDDTNPTSRTRTT